MPGSPGHSPPARPHPCNVGRMVRVPKPGWGPCHSPLAHSPIWAWSLLSSAATPGPGLTCRPSWSRSPCLLQGPSSCRGMGLSAGKGRGGEDKWAREGRAGPRAQTPARWGQWAPCFPALWLWGRTWPLGTLSLLAVVGIKTQPPPTPPQLKDSRDGVGKTQKKLCSKAALCWSDTACQPWSGPVITSATAGDRYWAGPVLADAGPCHQIQWAQRLATS